MSYRCPPNRVRLYKTWRLFTAVALLISCVAVSSGCGVASQGLNAEGTRYFQQGQHAAALRKFEQAIATNPQDADSYYNLASTYHQMGKSATDNTAYDQAENYYNQCLDINPDHVECYRGLAVMLVEQNRSAQAFRLLEGWKQRNPYSPNAKIELARLYQEFGDIGEAEENLLAAVSVDTSNPRARAALGKLREDQGDYNQAMANYQVSLKRNHVQPQLQARVAALSPSVVPAPAISPVGETRIVTGPPGSARY